MSKKVLHLLPCPFCAGDARAQPWHSGAPTQIMICCENQGTDLCHVAPMVTGETPKEAEKRWNRRDQIRLVTRIEER